MKKSAAEKLESLSIAGAARPSLGRTLGLDRGESLTTLALDKIVPNPNQPRRHRSEAKLEELTLSIRERGVLQPIRVREVKTNEQYEIIAGERRWRSAKAAGLPEIPAVIVREQAPEQAYIDALIENIVREDLNPIDRAEALIQIRVNLGLRSWDEVGKVGPIGLSRQQIYNLLGLTALPEAVQADIRAGMLTEKHGRALRLLTKTPKLLEKAHHEIKAKQLSGDDALELTKAFRKGEAKKAPRVLKITYRTNAELITALEAKLRELRPARRSR